MPNSLKPGLLGILGQGVGLASMLGTAVKMASDAVQAGSLKRRIQTQIAERFITQELGERTQGRYAFYIVQTVVTDKSVERGNVLMVTVCLASKKRGEYLRTCSACHWFDTFDEASGIVRAGRRMIRRLREERNPYIKPRTPGVAEAIEGLQGDSGTLRYGEAEFVANWPSFPPAAKGVKTLSKRCHAITGPASGGRPAARKRKQKGRSK